eukprot:189334-Pyramimonas_sp.AAC.1
MRARRPARAAPTRTDLQITQRRATPQCHHAIFINVPSAYQLLRQQFNAPTPKQPRAQTAPPKVPQRRPWPP